MRKLIAFWMFIAALFAMIVPDVSDARTRHITVHTVRQTQSLRHVVNERSQTKYHREEQKRFIHNVRAVQLPNTPIACLVSAVYHEARGEAEQNKVNVARVVLARTHNEKFPETVCGVVHQRTPSVHSRSATICQFSWYCHLSTHPVIDTVAYRKSYVAALKAMKLDQERGSFKALYFNSTGSWDPYRYYLVSQIGHIWYLGECNGRCYVPKGRGRITHSHWRRVTA